MLLSEIYVDGQNIRPRDRLEFDYHGTTRHGTVDQIRECNNGNITVFLKTKDGFKQFRTFDMTNVRIKTFWGYVRRLMS